MLHKGMPLARFVVDLLVGGILLVIVAITVAATANRYLFGGAMPWSTEFILLLWVWMIHFAALRTDHLRIEYFQSLMPPGVRTGAIWLVAMISVISLGVLSWASFKQALFFAGSRYVSLPAISESWEYVPFILVGPLWIVIIVLGLRDRARSDGG